MSNLNSIVGWRRSRFLALSKLVFMCFCLFLRGSKSSSSANGNQSTVNESDLKAELLKAVQKSAGVYQDASYNPSLSKTIIITGCNHGYLNFLRNFKCFTDRLKLKVLVFSMDQKIHTHVEEKMSPSISSFRWVGKEVVNEESAIFRSSQFNIITHAKTAFTLAIMELGYDVLFIDVDIVLVRDPVPFLMWKNVDYVFSHNKICPQFREWDFFKSEEEGNTGFFYVRSNEKTIQHWKNVLQIVPLHKDLDDQSVFWIQIRSSKDLIVHPLLVCGDYNTKVETTETKLIVCPLDGCLVSAGALRGVAYDWLRDNLKRLNETAVALHANYRKGNELKVKDLRDHGYWLITKNPDDSCKEFTPNL